MTTREKAELFLKSKGWNNDPSVWGIYSDEYVCEYHWNKFNDEFDDEYR